MLANPGCKRPSGGISVQNIPHRPVYSAGSAGFITLDLTPMTSSNKLFDPDLASEIAPGLALHLDPDRLLAEGATFTGDPVFRVQGQHFFVCIEAGGGSSRWAPLFTNANTGRVLLPHEGRAGHPKWVKGVFHLHPGQIWTASPDAVANAAARAHDKSRKGTRNTMDPTRIPKL